MTDLIETLETVPGAWKLELHFEGDGADRSLEIFLDASRLMEKIAATGTVNQCIIRRADVPRG